VNSDTTDLQQIREYLLGRLRLDQQSRVEERLLVDSDFYEELLIAEDEIVDQYVQGEMASDDRASFESHFIISPERQEKVRFARTLRKYVSAEVSRRAPELSSEMTTGRPADVSANATANAANAEGKSRWFGFLSLRNSALAYGLAAALVLIVVGGGWWATRTFWTAREPGNVFSVVLTPGLTRGDGPQGAAFSVASDVDTLRLQLLVTNNRYTSYEASLIDADGGMLTTRNNLKLETLNGQQAVVLDVDHSLVRANDYRVKLNGIGPNGNPEPVATYAFRIQNR